MFSRLAQPLGLWEVTGLEGGHEGGAPMVGLIHALRREDCSCCLCCVWVQLEGVHLPARRVASLGAMQLWLILPALRTSRTHLLWWKQSSCPDPFILDLDYEASTKML